MPDTPRFDQIRKEHQSRVEQVGRAEADYELYRALERAEGELDTLKKKILDMVQVTDRRGPFLPPHLGHPIPRPPCDVCGAPATNWSRDVFRHEPPGDCFVSYSPAASNKYGCDKHPARSEEFATRLLAGNSDV